MKCLALLPIAYAAAGFTTFAWLHETIPVERLSDKYVSTHNRDSGSVLGGVFWPVYWAGKGALAGVRALREAAKPALSCADAAGNYWAPGADNVCRPR